MDERPTIFERVPIFMIVIAALLLAAATGLWLQERTVTLDDAAVLRTQLLGNDDDDEDDDDGHGSGSGSNGSNGTGRGGGTDKSDTTDHPTGSYTDPPTHTTGTGKSNGHSESGRSNGHSNRGRGNGSNGSN